METCLCSDVSEIQTLPCSGSLNLNAFINTFERTLVILRTSTCAGTGMDVPSMKIRRRSEDSKLAATCVMRAARSTQAVRRSARPLSNWASSSSSLIRNNKREVFRRPDCTTAFDSFGNGVFNRVVNAPRLSVSGVRSSWLILAKN